MARKGKTVVGQTNSAPAQRQFTDREEPQESFIKALKEVSDREYSILTYYGVGGIGKSSLQAHLKSHHLDKNGDSIYSSIDFDRESNRMPYNTFRTLADKFKTNFKVPFTAFDIAYTIYWSKANPNVELKQESLPFLEEGGLLSGTIDLLDSVGGMASVALSAVDYAAKKIKDRSFNITIQEELKKLDSLEAEQIEDRLGFFFAYDIDNYKKKHPQKKVVIFLDTYEALWQNVRNESNRLSQDVWIRDGLVSELQNVLFVICGREKIIWAEDDSAWESDLNQHILGGLSENDAKSFLDSCNIEDIVIQDEIIKSSEGLPFYLDLSVDTYYKIKDSGKTPSVQDFSEVGKDDIFERFMRYLSLQEKETLKVLAHARFYTKDIFSLLVDTFKTAYPVTAMAELNTFSFISQEDDIFFIHDLMRKSLISSQSTDLKEDVNTTLFNLYDEKLQDLDIKNISEESIEALHEAFYHKECLGDINVLDDWYDKLYHIFKQAAKYKILLELSIKLNKLHETTLGEEHPSTAAGYHNLAVLHEAMGNHLEALSLYKQALAINEKVLGEEHPDTATIYNNLAVLYMDMGKLEEALPLCKKALAINEKVLGKEHPDTAMSYNNYANLYLSMGNSAEALPLYKKALEINKKELGEQHPKTAISYNNLAELYKSMRNYEEALPLYKKALAINEKALGEEHPHTAVSYNSLAGLYESMGNYEEALPLYKKALAINEKALGKDHPNTVGNYNNLAVCYYYAGDIDNALLTAQKGLGIGSDLYQQLISLKDSDK